MNPLQPRTGPFTPTGEEGLSLTGVRAGAIPSPGELAYHKVLPTLAQSGPTPQPPAGPAPVRPAARDGPQTLRRMC